ncbi:MAG: ribosome assembly RNA-binding protein YhbY [Gammaproteobacteria bacterium]|nr:MAG: ribosome assembly RNA-binding protein YhbY [Gammaproteobacteria bacterium]
MQLKENQLKHLKGLGHSLKPVVMIGAKGLTENVLMEIDNALEYHELIKVKITGADRNEKKSLIVGISDKTDSTIIAAIGNIALLFKRNSDKPKIELPK